MKEVLDNLLALEVGESEWLKAASDMNSTTIFSNPIFTSVYSDIFHLRPRYIVVHYNDSVSLLFCCYSRGKSVILPTHYLYNPLKIKEGFSEIIQNALLGCLIRFLKKSFNSIHIKLDFSHRDIRAFYWEGFSALHQYTYIKKLDQLNYSKNIERIIAKQKSSFKIKIEKWSEEVHKIHYNDFLAFDFKPSKTLCLLKLFSRLNQHDLADVFNCYDGTRLLSSNVVVKDVERKTSYMFLISRCIDYQKKATAALLYDYIFNFYREQGFEYVDLAGADFKTISAYKSKFSPDLMPLFELRYSKRRENLLKLFKGIKNVIKLVMKQFF